MSPLLNGLRNNKLNNSIDNYIAMKFNNFKIKYTILCAILFPVAVRIIFYSTNIEFGINFYIAPIIIGGIFGFLVGSKKDRWIEINKKIGSNVKKLEEKLNESELISDCLIRISSALRSTSNLLDLYKAIHKSLEKIIDVSNFYIAIYQESEDKIIFPYFVDAYDSHLVITDASKSGSLTFEVIKTGRLLLLNSDQGQEKYIEEEGLEDIGIHSEDWLGVPLSVDGITFGAIVVQDYTDPFAYDQRDAEILHSVAGQVASVIERRRAEEDLKNSLDDKQSLIEELETALNEIKTLKGIVPICASCKKIRDDKGYWNQVEVYIQQYTEAQFSHGICPECIERLYGKENWHIENKNKQKE